MVEPSGHCPYLGLKQNRAIRFASPTAEHRCYVTGEAQDIPVDQASYCLSQGHVNCPLYMGLSLPSTPVQMNQQGVATLPQGGLRGWLAGLSLRDRTIYIVLVALLVLILGGFVVVGVQLALGNNFFGSEPLPLVTPTQTATSTPTSTNTATLTATMAPSPSPSATRSLIFLPTLTSTATATPTPTFVPVIFPTNTPALPTVPAVPATDTPALPSATPDPTVATAEPISPTAGAITETPSATLEPPTPTALPPSPTPEPTATSQPPTATSPPPEPTTTPEPTAASSQQRLVLYFADATGTMFVPVARLSAVVSQQVAAAALRELIAGPRGDLTRLVPGDVRVLGVRREGSTLIANFDRRPAWPKDDRGLLAIALTLTEFPAVRQVQIQVNGANSGLAGGTAPISRQAFNVDNPQNLALDFGSGNRFLPLYFLNGNRRVRITRVVPRTDAVAEATLREWLAGPGGFADRLTRPVPAGTQLRGIRKDGDRAVVDFTAPFLDAPDRRAAVETLVLALTELRDSQGTSIFNRVEILVEGQKLSNFWGVEYDRQFSRPLLNPE